MIRIFFGSTGAALGAAAIVLASSALPASARADTVSFYDASHSSLGNTLTALGYDMSDHGIEDTAETFVVPGVAGTSTGLTFTFVQDVGGYQFSFGIFDYDAITADPATDRTTWGLQALASATEVFDNRKIVIGQTKTVDVAAGTRLGLFLIPDDTLASVLDDPSSFYGGSRPDPLFSVSNANPGAYDQLLTFESGGLATFAFEDLTRTGWSDEDFNDLVVTMRTSVSTQAVESLTPVPEPPTGILLLAFAGAASMWRRARA